MLLSFRPDVYEKIKSGVKIFEHRRNFPDEPIMAYMYVSSPVKAITGVVYLGKRHCLSDWMEDYKCCYSNKRIYRKDNSTNCVYKFIQVCMEPARGLNTQSAYEKRRFEINRVLMLKGIEIRDDGNFYKITKAESLSEVERRTRELKNKLSCYGAHQRVLICCREELLVDDYFHAVQEAVKGICDRVREMSGLLTDGNELIQTAFSVKNPYIVLNSLRTTSEQNQQNGLKEIILGLIHMVRNVTAHELRIRWDINENDAIDILQQVSFVHKYMDQCIPVRHLT